MMMMMMIFSDDSDDTAAADNDGNLHDDDNVIEEWKFTHQFIPPPSSHLHLSQQPPRLGNG